MKGWCNFMKNNRIFKVGVSVMFIGGSLISFFCGRKYEKGIINLALNNMARDGSTMRNEVDGKLYQCSVTEVENEL